MHTGPKFKITISSRNFKETRGMEFDILRIKMIDPFTVKKELKS